MTMKHITLKERRRGQPDLRKLQKAKAKELREKQAKEAANEKSDS
jgi:hypothetical protein